jgi:hypothetical protein
MTIFTIAPVTSSDVWIAGSYITTANQAQAFYEHFNGSQWTVVAAPTVGKSSTIYSMSVVSTNNIWAVGGYQTNANSNRLDTSLIEHWDGSHWSFVTHNGTTSDLFAVTALSSGNVWAVGAYYYYDNNYSTTRPVVATLTEHFDGSQWNIVSSSNPDKHSGLDAISPVSASDIWAVGIAASDAIADHYNGSNWSAKSPAAGSATIFSSVACVNAHDVWAVGNTAHDVLFDHWNGSSWVPAAHPSLSGSNNSFFSVLALQAQNVWALGVYSTNAATNLPRVLHLDSNGWSIVPLPDTLTRLYAWQRLSNSNTLIGVGIYNNQMRLITISFNLTREPVSQVTGNI